MQFFRTTMVAFAAVTLATTAACSDDETESTASGAQGGMSGSTGGMGPTSGGGDGGRSDVGGSDIGGAGGGTTTGSPPTGLGLSGSLTVSERLPVGEVLGAIAVEDPDVGDTHTVEIVGQNPLFAVANDALVLAGALDFETTSSHVVTLRATDQDGLTFEQTVTVNVTDEIEVTSLTDDGPGSLREVMANAAASATIFFDVSGTITLSSGLINVAQDVTLRGPGAGGVAISGGDSQGLFLVADNVRLEVSDLTFANGSGSLIIAGLGTDLVVADAVFQDSVSGSFGRGACILSAGALTVARSTFQRCVAFNAGAIDLNAGPVVIRDSLFADNATNGNSGGAMLIGNYAGTTLIENCTFFDNRAVGTNRTAGAIGMFSPDTPTPTGTITLRHNSFVGNDGEGGGGALDLGTGRSAVLEGNLFVGNTAGGTTPEDVRLTGGTVISGGYNFLEDGSQTGFVSGINGDSVGVTIAGVAASPADNGGPTSTIALQSSSPAIDAIPASACFNTTDQRGVARPAGNGCDVGAFEAP
ncbi:MAG: choice-of-anchor Q domain-containing protein [Myxococcota bacterium]